MFDYILLLLATALGLATSPFWCVLVIAALLTAKSSGRHVNLARRYAVLGEGRVHFMAASLNFANNFAFSLMSYGTGRVAGWLLST